MVIYSESGEIVESPDLENGWIEVKTSETIKEHHPAIPLEYHIEERDGKKIRVIDQQPKAAWDEYEQYGVYHPYVVNPNQQPSDTERIARLEEELKAAKILLGLEV